MSLAETQPSHPAAADPAPVEVRAVPRCEGSWSEVRDLAAERNEPVFKPVVPFVDDRGWSYMNLLAGVLGESGQVNVSVQHPGVVKAWHRHERQTDYWCCIGGHLKAGVYREHDHRAWMIAIGEQCPGVLVIPPPLWHGAAAIGATPATLFYYVTQKYDPARPDELRRSWDSVEGFPWGTRHG